jgi:HTH-type transcriptional repressor of NAD biosynthesis genes
MAQPLKIAVLGAECSGKSSLVTALQAHWQARGAIVVVAQEILRQWCDQHKRTPLAHEQKAIAQAQAELAENTTDADYLIADTSPLMTAIYSDVLFQDPSLYPFALSHQRIYQHTLVAGLDLPWQADGILRDGPAMRERIDARLREVLQREGLAFSMVYGQGPQRLAGALAVLEPGASTIPQARSNWRWLCDKCSDADCEHRLFSDLQAAATR